jgi:hypothetical protein
MPQCVELAERVQSQRGRGKMDHNELAAEWREVAGPSEFNDEFVSL